MPPFVSVKTLYRICIDNISEILYRLADSNKCTDEVRKYLLSSLHAGIRQDLISDATLKYKYSTYVSVASRKYKYNTYKLFDLLGLLLDSTIKILHPVDEDSNLWIDECLELFSRLESCHAIGLEELSVRVRINPRNDLEFVSVMNASFHRTLYGMQHLRILVLRSVCDNEVLRLLGVHCPNLEQLDMTSSWLVDDKGIRQLLLKNPGAFCEDDLSSSARCQLTPCCCSLKVVRIQDTNTTELGVILLLLFVPQLRSLGGFIYYRNIGDAVVCLLSWKPDLALRLTDLWDTFLPPDKADRLVGALPDLRSLYTRGTYLPNLSAWQHLSALTIDFDFIDFGILFEDYLTVAGHRLQKLTLIDQVHAVDLGTLCALCPMLKELSAKISCDLTEVIGQGEVLLLHLQVARIRLASAEVLPALLSVTPSIKTLEISYDQDGTSVDVDDRTMEQSVRAMLYASEPPTLETLAVRTESSLGWQGLSQLLDSCPNLTCVGDLYHFAGLTRANLEELERMRITRNWDLSIIFQGAKLPPRSLVRL